MPNLTHKQELFDAMADGYAKLSEQINRMAAYFVSVTSSPYGQAVKLLKTHVKMLK